MNTNYANINSIDFLSEFNYLIHLFFLKFNFINVLTFIYLVN